MAAMKPDYGLDAPQLVRRLASRAFLMMALTVILYFANRSTSPQNAGTVALLLLSIGLILAFIPVMMVLSSRLVKPRVCERLLDSMRWKGNEKVLDVGCGRGLFLIRAAKRVKNGLAIGIDNWKAGNSEQAALSNAKLEGVAGHVKIQTADATKLPFEDDEFDVVVSSMALHSIRSGQDRAKALREIARVLKPGGRLAILDIIYTGSYAKTLRTLGIEDIWLSPMTFLWCVPTRSLTGRKA